MGDLAQRSQLFNRACELARARLHLVEQPHVLDRDHRLACESCQQCNLLVREWPHFGATNHERANGLVLPQQGNGENGPVSEAARVRASIVQHETTRFHHAARRRGGPVAARGTPAAVGDASDRVPQQWNARRIRALLGCIPPKPESRGLCGRSLKDRILPGPWSPAFFSYYMHKPYYEKGSPTNRSGKM